MASTNANPAGGDGGARQISDVQEHGEISQNCLAAQAELPITISQWAKNSREQILVQLTEYGGRVLVGARVWFMDDTGELKPSKSGLTVSIRHLPRLAAAYADALAEARARGLVPEEGGAA